MEEVSPLLSIYGTSPHGLDTVHHQGPVPWSAPSLAPITVVTPSIPPRLHMLNRALKSIQRQTLQPEQIIVQVDAQGVGAAKTRNKALQRVEPSSEAVAFLDDDDYFKQDHLQICWDVMIRERADYVYPWFTIGGPSYDPFHNLSWHLKPWHNNRPHQTTIVTLVRRELAQEVGFREVDHTRYPDLTEEGFTFGEDYQFTMECLARGAKIYHVQERTWVWVVTGHNTSGRGDAWQHAR